MDMTPNFSPSNREAYKYRIDSRIEIISNALKKFLENICEMANVV